MMLRTLGRERHENYADWNWRVGPSVVANGIRLGPETTSNPSTPSTPSGPRHQLDRQGGAYGLEHSETVVGKAVKDCARGLRLHQGSLVGTKVERSRTTFRLRRSHEAEASLQRLESTPSICIRFTGRLERRPESASPGSIEEAMSKGRSSRPREIRNIGVSNSMPANAEGPEERSRRLSQPPYSCSRGTSETSILPFAQQHSIGVIVYSPMALEC